MIELDGPALAFAAWREAERSGNEDLSWFMRHVLRISDIAVVPREDERVQTAAISRSGSQFRIRVNEGFLEDYVRTPRDLLHVLAHEVGHRVRGDLFESERGGMEAATANVAADMSLNSALRWLAFRGNPPPYHERLYAGSHTLMRLMCSPEFVGEDVETSLAAGFPAMLDALGARRPTPPRPRWIEDLSALYRHVWDRAASRRYALAELCRILRQIVEACDIPPSAFERPGVIVVVGGHAGEPDDAWWKWFFRRSRCGQLGLRMGAGRGDVLSEERFEPAAAARESWRFYERVRRALAYDPLNRARTLTDVPESSVVPLPGRREAFYMAMGYVPAFFPNVQRHRDWSDQRVHLYIDVSGSIMGDLPWICGLVLHAGDLLGDHVFAFSNEAEPLTLSDLRAGRFRTTGGTDFDCVWEYALSHRHRRILILSDGYANLDDGLAARGRAAGMEVYAVLMGSVVRRGGDSDLVREAGGEAAEGRKWWHYRSDGREVTL